MIRQGDTIENHITGERVTFMKTSAETGGEYVLIETTVAPDDGSRRGGAVANHVRGVAATTSVLEPHLSCRTRDALGAFRW